MGHDDTAVGLNGIELNWIRLVLVYVGRVIRRRLTGHNLE